MSATLDTNVLLYAVDEGNPRHEECTALVASIARGTAITYIFWPVLLGFVRIATNATILRNPLSMEAALGNVHALLSLPHLRTPSETASFWPTLVTLASRPRIRGARVTDAHIVALMRCHGVDSIWTYDRDFRTFDDVKVLNPARRVN